ncbi:MAG: hypothetical protein M1840_007363 [Geoglossum simile]|nr:MAG: hypothetical protein M1840_007363 [Geoglossum simile]
MPAPARTSNTARLRAEMPPYQPQEYPITAAQARQIASLSQSHSFTKLKKHLQDACDIVTTLAGDANDRSVEKQGTHKRRTARRAQLGLDDDEYEEERAQEVLGYAERAEQMTDEMEAITRDIIDSGDRVLATENVIRDLSRDVAAGPRTSQAIASGQGRRGPRGSSGAESDESEQGGNEDQNPVENFPRPLEMLQASLSQYKTQYESQSLRARYANHNSYIGFKRIVHDSRHPEDNPPPLPNPNTWFPSENGSSATRASQAHRGAQVDDDDDIEIEKENISLNCPLTLLPFKDPVSSKKCPHSFERTAILPMIQNSEARLGGTRRGDGERAVKCPICEQMLTINDLYPDKVLLRRIKRHERGDDSSDADDKELPGATQLEEILDDSAMDIDGFGDREQAPIVRRSMAPKIKAEKVSKAKAVGASPATRSRSQMGYNSSGAFILDLEHGEESG